jgi:hypothetical protein
MSSQISRSFDPYHRWLGIPRKDQPANHYRLLGIEIFEDDPAVIESAADRQMAHVRSFQTGPRDPLSQQILNELSTARICLLAPEKKTAYDRQLNIELTAKDTTAQPANSVVSTDAVPSQKLSPMTPLVPRQQAGRPSFPESAVSPASTMQPAVAVQSQKPRLKRRAGRAWWKQPGFQAATVVLMLLCTAFLILRLATDTGELVIEVSEPNVEVIVSRNGKIVESIKMDQQRKTITIHCGSYGIELKGTGIDSLEVDARRITVRRGEKVVVRITRQHDSAAGKQSLAADAADVPSISRPVERPKDGEQPQDDTHVAELPERANSAAEPSVGAGPYALQFDGRHYVELAETKEVASWNNSFTAEIWVRWRKNDSTHLLMGTLVRPPSIRDYGGWSLGARSNNKSHVMLPTVHLGGSISNFSLSDAKWHHVAFVHDKNGGATTYVDGRWVAGGRSDYHDKQLANFCLGVPRNADLKANFHGAIRAFRLSSLARYQDAFNVPQEYDFTTDANTIVLLDFSRTQGQRIEDLSGNGRHREFVGAQWISAANAK